MGLHGALGTLRILVAEQLAENRGDDLPGEAELVLQPAAAIGAAAGGKFVPKIVDLFLGLAVDEKGDGGCELELRAAVEGEEFRGLRAGRSRTSRSLWVRARIAVASNLPHLRVFENGDVEVGGFLGVAIEPQEWGDFLHRTILSVEMESLPVAQEHSQEWLCHKIVSDGYYFLPAASFLPTALWCSTASLGAKSSISKIAGLRLHSLRAHRTGRGFFWPSRRLPGATSH